MQALHKQIGSRIRALREEKGIAQEGLAAICNLHRTYVGLIERGQRNLSLKTIEIIAAGLEIPVAKLFEGVGEDLPASKPQRTTKAAPPTVQDLAAHVETIRGFLIAAKVANTSEYQAQYKRNRQKLSSAS